MSTPSFDAKLLRNAFGTFATGVTIVTTRGPDGGDVGLTANSFSSVSLAPAMVLWSLAKTSSNIDAFRAATHFAVHILAADQESLSAAFARKGVDRFAGLLVDRGPGDTPLLRGCAAQFACRMAFQHEGGDHVIFVGEVLDFEHADKAPLVFHGGRFGVLLRREFEAPEPARDIETATTPNDLIFHISQAYYRIRRDAMKDRVRRGWSDIEYSAMSVLGRTDALSVAEIDQILSRDRGRRVNPAVMSSLAARGLIELTEPVDMSSIARLTPEGRRAMLELMAILKSGEAEALETFDRSEISLLRQLLRRIGSR